MWKPLVTTKINKENFESLLNGDIPAIIIKEFFDKRTCQTITKKIANQDNERFQNGKLKHIGPFLMSYTTKKKQYFQQVKKSEETFHKIFTKENNPNEKICKYISRILPKYHVSIAKEQDQKYSPFVIRIHDKGKTIPIHKDEVRYEGRDYNISQIDKQLSFILHLQESEKGGKLIIYKKLWHKSDEKFRNIDFGYSSDLIESSEFVKIPNINSGDLVIINPNHYHEVTKIDGDIPRITVGMFLGIQERERKIVTWA